MKRKHFLLWSLILCLVITTFSSGLTTHKLLADDPPTKVTLHFFWGGGGIQGKDETPDRPDTVSLKIYKQDNQVDAVYEKEIETRYIVTDADGSTKEFNKMNLYIEVPNLTVGEKYTAKLEAGEDWQTESIGDFEVIESGDGLTYTASKEPKFINTPKPNLKIIKEWDKSFEGKDRPEEIIFYIDKLTDPQETYEIKLPKGKTSIELFLVPGKYEIREQLFENSYADETLFGNKVVVELKKPSEGITEQSFTNVYSGPQEAELRIAAQWKGDC